VEAVYRGSGPDGILDPMRVLFLTSRMPYAPVGGDRFRVFHMLRAAAEAGHSVHLLSFDKQQPEPLAVAPLEEIVRSVEVVPLPQAHSILGAAQAIPGSFPLQAAYYRSRRMEARVEAALARVRPHVVVTHLFRMAPYAIRNMGGRGRRRWILDLTDVISAGIERSLPFRRGLDRWLYAIEGPRIRNYEARIAPRFDECWVISQAESRYLSALAPTATVRVVSNGMGPGRMRAPVTREGARLLFLGYHDVFHNKDAVRFLVDEIFPHVRARVPEATLAIAGKGSEAIRAWADHRTGVRVLGFVDDPDEELARATVFVAPHRFAAGVQNKVVQALAAGTPVVTTSAVQAGLEPIPDGVLRVADDAEAIAAHVIELIRDRSGAAASGALGRAWAHGRFCWNTSGLALQEVHGADARPRIVRPPIAALPV
jgi:glycosyltransferase involved in cell wall biosynthesis